MKYKRILAFVFFLSFAALSAKETEEIRVELATRKNLTPTYISEFQLKESLLGKNYAQDLHSILTRDFKYNGYSHVLPLDSKKESFLKRNSQSEVFDRTHWKDQGVANLISLAVEKSKLIAKAFNVQTGSLKTLKDISLSGEISRDRRQIHKLADALYNAFFGKEGIASTRILYSYYLPSSSGKESNWISEIWECDWDGENSRQITNDGNYCISPVYVPPSKGETLSDSFLYVSYKLGQPKVYKANLGGGRGSRVLEIRGNQLLPSIASDLSKIAFICDAGGRADLFMQAKKEGETGVEKPSQLFSFPRSTQASPTFSPDGTQIAFVSDKDGSPKIYTISAKTTKKRQEAKLLTKKIREATCPTWSSDGRKLAYSAKVGRVRQIWIYDIDTGEETQLTTGPGNKENPAWAPDSLHIVFNSVDGESSELYIINTNQPEAIKISKGLGKKHYPSWGRSKVGI